MLFLGIISWKGVSCFNEGGDVFQMGGTSFLSFKWVAPHRGVGLKKNCRMG